MFDTRLGSESSSSSNCFVYYCCFFDPVSGERFAGQRNLSAHLFRYLKQFFADSFRPLANSGSEIFPSVFRLVFIANRVIFVRWMRGSNCKGYRDVTLIDVIHSLVDLPKDRYFDHLVLIGHDSYALRALREFRCSTNLFAFLRNFVSWLCWKYVEFLAKHIFSHSFFVSPVDMRNTILRSNSSVISIPLSDEIPSAVSRNVNVRNHSVRRILVAVPVINVSQNKFDVWAIKGIQELVTADVEVVIWGSAARRIQSMMPETENYYFVEWVEDYISFLQSFDLLIYPRVIGSGFHTKVAESLVLGLPCICIDWIAEALKSAGYDGLTCFTSQDDFRGVLKKSLQSQSVELPSRDLPRSVQASASLEPILKKCIELLGF